MKKQVNCSLISHLKISGSAQGAGIHMIDILCTTLDHLTQGKTKGEIKERLGLSLSKTKKEMFGWVMKVCNFVVAQPLHELAIR